MSRRKGEYGEYGLRGSSNLAKRKRIERDNPGYRVCRGCGVLIDEQHLRLSCKTPYCSTCESLRSRSYAAKKPKSEWAIAMAQVLSRNKELIDSSQFHCTGCGLDKPLSDKSQNGSKCKGCRSKYLSEWAKTKRARTTPKIQPSSELASLRSYQNNLEYSVAKVFRLLGVIECKIHGYQGLAPSGFQMTICCECARSKTERRRVLRITSPSHRSAKATSKARSRQNTLDYIRNEKMERGCLSCGYSRHAAALHFHHRDPESKLFNLSVAAGKSIASIIAEIAKCDVLCANCHAEHTSDNKHSRIRLESTA